MLEPVNLEITISVNNDSQINFGKQISRGSLSAYINIINEVLELTPEQARVLDEILSKYDYLKVIEHE